MAPYQQVQHMNTICIFIIIFLLEFFPYNLINLISIFAKKAPQGRE